MIELSSFLIPTESILWFINEYSLIALVLMIGLLVFMQKALFSQDGVSRVSVFIPSLLVTALISMVLVLVLQIVAMFVFEAVYAAMTESRSGAGAARAIGAASSGRVGFIAMIVLGITFLIGGGYAVVYMESSIFMNFAGSIIGVGFLEEAMKLLAATIIFFCFYRKLGLRYSLAPFAIAGLGFGAGEALHYFGAYAMYGSDLRMYILRALWCVSLHAAWTLISGSLVVQMFGRIPNLTDLSGEDYCRVLLCLAPSAILHGIYNGFCWAGSGFFVTVGIISLIWGLGVLFSPKEEFAPRGCPEDRVDQM